MGAWVFLSFVEESSEQQDSDVITDWLMSPQGCSEFEATK